MAQLSLESVTKQFPDGTTAVNSLSIAVANKEFLVLVGPSGCGKSTTLRMIAGLEHPQSGEIKIAGVVVNDMPPKDRNIAMVFQNYALYPHMSVYRNLSFGLLLRYGGGVLNRGLIRIFRPRKAAELKRLRSGIDHQVRHAAQRLGISHLLNRKPHQLSGGERQRVALGRAIVRDPAVFLFDEPLSNLDAKLRHAMRLELKQLHRELEATVVYVTHDQVEAMTLGDRVAVMKDGELLQIGTPAEVYQRPVNTFVAQFIGSVPMNLVHAGVVGASGEDGEASIDQQVVDRLIGFRAEHASITEKDGDPANDDKIKSSEIRFAGTVDSIDQLGDSTLVGLKVRQRSKSKEESAGLDPAAKEQAGFGETSHNIDRSTVGADTVVVTVRAAGDCSLVIGQRVTVHVDRERLMWFDLETGYNLDRENS